MTDRRLVAVGIMDGRPSRPAGFFMADGGASDEVGMAFPKGPPSDISVVRRFASIFRCTERDSDLKSSTMYDSRVLSKCDYDDEREEWKMRVESLGLVYIFSTLTRRFRPNGKFRRSTHLHLLGPP